MGKEAYTLFDLDLLPKAPASKDQTNRAKQDQYFLSVACSLENAASSLRMHPAGPFLVFDSSSGWYREGTRAPNGSVFLRPLVVKSPEELGREGKTYGGLLMYTERAHTLGSQTMPYIGSWTDRLGRLATEVAFFTAFIKDSDNDPVPQWLTQSMKGHMNEVLVPNHGSHFDKGKILRKSSIPGYTILTSSRNIRPEIISSPNSSEGVIFESLPDENGQIVIDFSKSFEIELDKMCNTCGERMLAAQYRDGADHVQIGCGCGYHREIPKSVFAQKYGNILVTHGQTS